MLQVERFEPVYLMPEGPARLTEYGKRWLDDLLEAVAKTESPPMLGGLTSGLSQFAMAKLIDHVNGKTSFTSPATVAIALCTAAPTSTSTGASITEAAYTGYTEQVIAGAGFNAASSATPSVSTNNGAITFPNCTASTSTLLGFVIKDSSSIGSGNCLWYGTLASTVISTTQTPPTIANAAMSLSITGT